MRLFNVLLVSAVCAAAAKPVVAQDAAQTGSSSSDARFLSSERTPALEGPGCNPVQLEIATRVTLQERLCLYKERLITPGGIAHSAFSSAFGQWRNVPFERNEDMDDFAHRVGVFYARHVAQNTGEFLGAYLNHEDPRPRVSREHGWWKRTRSALFSVVVVQNADGGGRPAFAPLAGAFGSGFAGMACYRNRDTLADGLRSTGLSYGGYFASAVAHEFRPDLMTLVNRRLHKKKQD